MASSPGTTGTPMFSSNSSRAIAQIPYWSRGPCTALRKPGSGCPEPDRAAAMACTSWLPFRSCWPFRLRLEVHLWLGVQLRVGLGGQIAPCYRDGRREEPGLPGASAVAGQGPGDRVGVRRVWRLPAEPADGVRGD